MNKHLEKLESFGFYDHNGTIAYTLKNKTNINFLITSGLVMELGYDRRSRDVEVTIKDLETAELKNYTIMNSDFPVTYANILSFVKLDAGKDDYIAGIINHSEGKYIIFSDAEKTKIKLGLGNELGTIEKAVQWILGLVIGVPLVLVILQGVLFSGSKYDTLLGGIVFFTWVLTPIFFGYQIYRLNSGKKELYKKILELFDAIV